MPDVCHIRFVRPPRDFPRAKRLGVSAVDRNPHTFREPSATAKKSEDVSARGRKTRLITRAMPHRPLNRGCACPQPSRKQPSRYREAESRARAPAANSIALLQPHTFT